MMRLLSEDLTESVWLAREHLLSASHVPAMCDGGHCCTCIVLRSRKLEVNLHGSCLTSWTGLRTHALLRTSFQDPGVKGKCTARNKKKYIRRMQKIKILRWRQEKVPSQEKSFATQLHYFPFIFRFIFLPMANNDAARNRAEWRWSGVGLGGSIAALKKHPHLARLVSVFIFCRCSSHRSHCRRPRCCRCCRCCCCCRSLFLLTGGLLLSHVEVFRFKTRQLFHL